jgi:16S rRNA (adenine1518-N6/adenine1519-N6)-dimethyltransferase
MIAVLKAELGDNERFEVIEGDAATVDIAKLAGRDRVALAGNLPYAITGEIMRNLGKYAENISRAAVMVQMEVRDRLIAEPNTREYGVLSVFIQARFDVRTALKVSANAFHPPPKVESAVVMMVPREVPRAEETESFRTVVRGAFQARRKTLRNALVQAVGAERADEALSRAGIDGRRRGETLSIEEFAIIAQELH